MVVTTPWPHLIKNSGERYKRNNSLPEVPTFKNYQKLLSELIDRLNTVPKIALCTLPPIGEYQDSSINQHINIFNDCIKLTAQEKNISLLPVSDSLWDELDKRLYPLRSHYDPNTLPILRRIYGGVIHHYVFKKILGQRLLNQKASGYYLTKYI